MSSIFYIIIYTFFVCLYTIKRFGICWMYVVYMLIFLEECTNGRRGRLVFSLHFFSDYFTNMNSVSLVSIWKSFSTLWRTWETFFFSSLLDLKEKSSSFRWFKAEGANDEWVEVGGSWYELDPPRGANNDSAKDVRASNWVSTSKAFERRKATFLKEKEKKLYTMKERKTRKAKNIKKFEKKRNFM